MAKVRVKGFDKIDATINALNRTRQSKNNVKTSIKITTDLVNSKDLTTLTKQFPDAIDNAHLKTLRFVAEELEIALGVAMETNAWNWDYGDGDIVDTGALRDSVSVEVIADSIRVSYGEEYAAIVYYGGYIHPYGNPRVQIYMPPRPWVNAVLNGGGPVPQFNVADVYGKYFFDFLRKELKGSGLL